MPNPCIGIKHFLIKLPVKQTEDGYVVCGRTAEDTLRLGDEIGGCVIAKLEAYGKELQEFDPGLTGAITLKGKHLYLSLLESRPLCYNLDDLKKERDYIDQLIEELEAKNEQT